MAQSPDPGRSVPHTFDRGRAEYFHGRHKPLANFRRTCEAARRVEGGTTFLVQGAPGAGKTALLNECVELAARDGWLVAKDVTHMAFSDAIQMRTQMRNLHHFRVEDGAVVPAPGGATRDTPVNSPFEVLQQGGTPLLLVIDEAQNLRTLSDRPFTDDAKASAIETIGKIHNGSLGRPVVLLAGGLSNTVSVFENLGVSRFDGECYNVLGALEPDAERAVIRDWVQFHAEVLADSSEWIDAIMKETHGWPQHTIAYVRPAMRRIAHDGGILTPQGLAHVLEQGRQGREDYYKARTHTFDNSELTTLVSALPAVGGGDRATKESIMKSLAATYPRQEAERLFNHAVHKGVLSKEWKHYSVPIPSMHAWLEREYGEPRLDRAQQINGERLNGAHAKGPDLER